MDFVEGFTKVGGKSVILTVVDCLSKYAHFITLGHPYSTSVAKAFLIRLFISMACPPQLLVTVIQFSQAMCGRNCFVSQTLSCG
jgi:hypothetical protein